MALVGLSAQPNEYSVYLLLYNVRGLIDIQKCMDFSNVLTNCNHFKFCFLTETWFVPENQDNALFLNNFTTHRKHRYTENDQTKYGGVLIAFPCAIKHRRIQIDPKYAFILLVQVDVSDYKSLKRCVYSVPQLNQYIHPHSILSILLDTVDTLRGELLTKTMIIIGDSFLI